MKKRKKTDGGLSSLSLSLFFFFSSFFFSFFEPLHPFLLFLPFSRRDCHKRLSLRETISVWCQPCLSTLSRYTVVLTVFDRNGGMYSNSRKYHLARKILALILADFYEDLCYTYMRETRDVIFLFDRQERKKKIFQVLLYRYKVLFFKRKEEERKNSFHSQK